MVWRRRQDIFTNHYLMNERINHEAVCKTAPVTPGLVIRQSDSLIVLIVYIDLEISYISKYEHS